MTEPNDDTRWTDLVKAIQDKIDRARASRNQTGRTADTMQKLPESPQ